MLRKFKTDAIYSIGTVARELEVSVHLLRVYEKEGLILTEKTPTGRRLYSELEIEKIRCIKRMIRENGLNFEGIRRLLSLIPCWRLRDCALEDKNACPAFSNSVRPCWATEKKCAHPLPSCRQCEVYQCVVDCHDLKMIMNGEN